MKCPLCGGGSRLYPIEMPHFDGDELAGLLLENLRDYAIFSLDSRRRIAEWNSGAQRLFGYSAGEIIGKSFATLASSLDGRAHSTRQGLDQASKAGRFEDETWWIRKDGSWFHGQCIYIARRDGRKQLRGFAVVAGDISIRAQALEDRATLRVTYYHAPIGIARVALDGGGQILDVNDKYCEILGYSRDELLRMNVAQISEPAAWEREFKLIRQLRADQIESYSIEKSYQIRRGQIRWVRVTSSKAGRFVGRAYRIAIVEDITAWKESEAALRDSEQRVRAILETAVDAIITIDDHGIVRSANPATRHLFGYREEELLGKNVKALMPEPYHREHDGYLRRYLKTGRAKIIGIGREVTGLRKDGTTFPMNLSVSEVKAAGGRLFTGIVHDLSGRRRLERQILEVASNEQRRIGQDLHDGLCQDLIGIAFAIDTASRSLPADASSARDSLADIAASVRDAAGQARDFAHGLNPVDVRAGGFVVAVEHLARKVSQSFGIRCTFHSAGVARVRDDTTATHLYRIAQEAVSNAIRHGKADHVRVELAEYKTGLALSITDNGSGISKAIGESVKKGMATTKEKSIPTGIGLQTMHYRARVIGGTFEVMPRKGGGTVVTCRIGN